MIAGTDTRKGGNAPHRTGNSRLLGSLELNLRAMRARAYVRVVGVNRELSWLFFDIFLPLFGVAAYVYVYRSLDAPPAYAGFVILGGAMTAYWLNVLWAMASQFYWDKETGNLEVFYLSPMSPMAVLFGMSVGGLIQTSLRAFTTMILGSWLFGVHFQVESPGALAAAFLLTMAALYGLGMALASFYLMYGREAWHISNLLQEPVYLVAGLQFPIKALGMTVALTVSFLPLTVGMDAVRQLLYPGAGFGYLPVAVEIGILVLLSGIFLTLAQVGLRWMERAAKREGRLTLRWQ